MKALHYILAAAVVFLAACVRHSESGAAMDLADAVMEERPDSALRILRGVDSFTLSGDNEKARYALLMSQALDKNYIDVTDDSLINVAEEYYAGQAPGRERMLTAFYKARIEYNSERYEEAAKDIASCMDIAEHLGDTLWMARSNETAADIYTKTFAYKRASDHRAAAASLYGAAGKRLNEIYARGELSLELSALKYFDQSVEMIDSMISVSYAEYPDDSLLQANLLSISLRVYSDAGQYDKALASLDQRKRYMHIKPFAPSDYIDAGYIHLHYRDMEEARRYAAIADSACTQPEELLQLSALNYSLSINTTDRRDTYVAADTFFSLINDNLPRMLSNSASNARGDYYKSTNHLTGRQSMEKSRNIGVLFGIIFCVLTVTGALVGIMIKYRKKNKILRDEIISELGASNLNLYTKVDDMQKTVEENEHLRQSLLHRLRTLEEKQRTILRDDKDSYKKIFSQIVDIINSMSVQHFSDINSTQSKAVLKEKLGIESTILRAPATTTLFIETVDKINDGILSKIRKAMPNLSEDNIKFVALVLAGVNTRMIAHMMDIKYDSISSKKMRLFKKIDTANIDGWQQI